MRTYCIYKANPTGVCGKVALFFFCKMASVETWCFLKHSIIALSDGKVIFPDTATKMEKGGTKRLGWEIYRHHAYITPSPHFSSAKTRTTAQQRKESPAAVSSPLCKIELGGVTYDPGGCHSSQRSWSHPLGSIYRGQNTQPGEGLPTWSCSVQLFYTFCSDCSTSAVHLAPVPSSSPSRVSAS